MAQGCDLSMIDMFLKHTSRIIDVIELWRASAFIERGWGSVGGGDLVVRHVVHSLIRLGLLSSWGVMAMLLGPDPS